MAVLSSRGRFFRARRPGPGARAAKRATTSGKALARLYYLTRPTKTVMLRRLEKRRFRSHADVKLLRSQSLQSAFMHQSIPAAPSLPPRADLGHTLPWIANSRGWGLLSCQIPRGGDEKRGQMPRPSSTLQHFSLTRQSEGLDSGGGGRGYKCQL